jgi:hypothetical protein
MRTTQPPAAVSKVLASIGTQPPSYIRRAYEFIKVNPDIVLGLGLKLLLDYQFGYFNALSYSVAFALLCLKLTESSLRSKQKEEEKKSVGQVAANKKNKNLPLALSFVGASAEICRGMFNIVSLLSYVNLSVLTSADPMIHAMQKAFTMGFIGGLGYFTIEIIPERFSSVEVKQDKNVAVPNKNKNLYKSCALFAALFARNALSPLAFNPLLYGLSGMAGGLVFTCFVNYETLAEMKKPKVFV